MENKIKVEFKTPFKGFSGKYDKYDKQYLYIQEQIKIIGSVLM